MDLIYPEHEQDLISSSSSEDENSDNETNFLPSANIQQEFVPQNIVI